MGVGGVVNAGLAGKFSLQFEPMYLQKYTTFEQTPKNPELELQASYVECPILIKFIFGKTFQPYFIAGPTFGFLLASEMVGDAGGLQFTADSKKIMKTMDFGLSFGGGFQLPICSLIVFLESRYTWGIMNINKGGVINFTLGSLVVPTEVDPNSEMKSSGLQVMAGILIPL